LPPGNPEYIQLFAAIGGKYGVAFRPFPVPAIYSHLNPRGLTELERLLKKQLEPFPFFSLSGPKPSRGREGAVIQKVSLRNEIFF